MIWLRANKAVMLQSGQNARSTSLRLGLVFGPPCGPALALASVQCHSLSAFPHFLLSVVPPEFGMLPALCVRNGDFRRAISGTRLTGAFRSAQGVSHRPAPLLCWVRIVLFPFIAFVRAILSRFSRDVKGLGAVAGGLFLW